MMRPRITFVSILCGMLQMIAMRADAQKHVDLKLQYQFPLSNSKGIPTATSIILRPGDVLNNTTVKASLFTVVGAKSGAHSGSVSIADDKKTMIFKPAKLFTSGEKVTVTLLSGIKTITGGSVGSYSLSFTIAATIRKGSSDAKAMHRGITTSPTAALPFDFPTLTANIIDQPASGDLFLSTFDGSTFPPETNPYAMIVNDSAKPVYYRSGGLRVWNFSIQPNGMLTYFDDAAKTWYALDSNYNLVDSFACANGYTTDMHDMVALPDGRAILIAEDTLYHYDMSQHIMGGNANAAILGCVIQVLDKSKNVIFNWRSFDEGNYDPLDAVHENMLSDYLDAVHMNSVQLDADGNILASARNLDEITKISIDSGEIIWRMGGSKNQFTFLNDSLGYSHQHGLHLLPNGHVLIFDNGNFHVPAFSRACEYELDQHAKTAKLVWQFDHNKEVSSLSMGNVQRLENGNTLIGWGFHNYPAVTEVTPEGKITYELSIQPPQVSYRAYRYPWKARLSGVSGTVSVSQGFKLGAVQPSIAHQSATFTYSLPHASDLEIKLVDLMGRTIATVQSGTATAGEHIGHLAASTLASGKYYLVLNASGAVLTQPVIIERSGQ